MTSYSTTTVTVGEGEGDKPVAPIPDITVEIPVNPTSIDEYEYLGCFGSAPSFTKVKECESMTLEICVEKCREQQIPYAGVCGHECYCGEDIDAEMRAAWGSKGKCDKPCPGNPETCCGGGVGEERLFTVYGCVPEDPLPVPPPMAGPLAHDIADQEYVATVGHCERCHPGPSPAPTPGPGDPPFSSPGEGYGDRPPHNPVVVVSRANPRQPPSRLSVLFGVLGMLTVMMII